ncbi:hypothetical protein [Paraburkholderia youngii]|uniref:hypothetical protein n=1 Tax=Paraburkholderia youngii TaxID=2782701 RepID=UPI003D1BC9CE
MAIAAHLGALERLARQSRLTLHAEKPMVMVSFPLFMFGAVIQLPWTGGAVTALSPLTDWRVPVIGWRFLTQAGLQPRGNIGGAASAKFDHCINRFGSRELALDIFGRRTACHEHGFARDDPLYRLTVMREP